MAMSLPRTFRISSSLSFSKSRPPKTTSPETILPGGWGIKRISETALTLLPQPDSPTSPRASPSLSVNETPLTALTTPSGVKNWVRRSFTARSGGLVLGCGMALLPETVGGSVTDSVGGGCLAGRIQVDQQQA